jgi:hypothetical protein
MSRRARRGVFVSLAGAAALGAAVIVVFVPRSGAAKAQALPDIGKFRAGSVLGEERAGFSGRPKLQVLLDPGDPRLEEVAACLRSAEVEAALDSFTPILIDAGAESEAEVERVHRERDGLRVIVRGLDGGFRGGLREGFGCADLLGLLDAVRRHSSGPPEKSPIYALLVAHPEAIEVFATEDEVASGGVGRSGRERALRYLDLLREFEGEESPAVKAVEARLLR